MNITNPKVTLFFLAFLPQFADPARGGLTAQIIALGALFQLATLLVFGCVSLLAGRVAGRFNSSVKGQLFLNRAAGCVFTGLAVMLLVSSVDRPPDTSPYTLTAFRKGRYPFRYKDPFHGGPPSNSPFQPKGGKHPPC